MTARPLDRSAIGSSCVLTDEALDRLLDAPKCRIRATPLCALRATIRDYTVQFLHRSYDTRPTKIELNRIQKALDHLNATLADCGHLDHAPPGVDSRSLKRWLSCELSYLRGRGRPPAGLHVFVNHVLFGIYRLAFHLEPRPSRGPAARFVEAYYLEVDNLIQRSSFTRARDFEHFRKLWSTPRDIATRLRSSQSARRPSNQTADANLRESGDLLLDAYEDVLTTFERHGGNK